MKIFEGKTILVADDDPGNRELVVSTMSNISAKVKVVSATNGKHVLEILGKRKVDALLLDWEMPLLNGYEVLIQMQRQESWKEIPVLMYTGVMTASTNLVKALEAGAIDFIRKPTEPIELIARVKSVLLRNEMFEERIRLEQENSAMRNKLLEAEVEMLQSELSNHLVQLARKNEVLIGLRERLLESKSLSEHQSLIEHIESMIVSENYWDDFFQKFSRVDQRFTSALAAQHPDLTANEIKFCMLIKAGMNSKDIASLMNVTPSAIEKTRYRIRKKMSLEPETSFERYIIMM